jgi:prevent-host-death family protein
MPVVGLRQLSRETREVIEQLEKDGEPVVVTRHGRPIAALTPVSEREAAALALAIVPEFVASRERAARSIEAGEGKPVSELLAEFEAEDAKLEPDEEEAEEFERFVIPTALIAYVARVAARTIPRALAGEEPIQTLNLRLADLLVRDSLVSVYERVRTVNENIIAEVGTEAGEVSLDDYVSELERVAEVQQLASRSPTT